MPAHPGPSGKKSTLNGAVPPGLGSASAKPSDTLRIFESASKHPTVTPGFDTPLLLVVLARMLTKLFDENGPGTRFSSVTVSWTDRENWLEPGSSPVAADSSDAVDGMVE